MLPGKSTKCSHSYCLSQLPGTGKPLGTLPGVQLQKQGRSKTADIIPCNQNFFLCSLGKIEDEFLFKSANAFPAHFMHSKMKICFTKVKKCPELGILLTLQDAITPRVIPTPDNLLGKATCAFKSSKSLRSLVLGHTVSSCCGLGSTHCSMHKALPVLVGGTGHGECPKGWWSAGLSVMSQKLSTCVWGILPTALHACTSCHPTPYLQRRPCFCSPSTPAVPTIAHTALMG